MKLLRFMSKWLGVCREEKLIDAGGKKKSLVRKFREDSILL
jgi:hypothetical protein